MISKMELYVKQAYNLLEGLLGEAVPLHKHQQPQIITIGATYW